MRWLLDTFGGVYELARLAALTRCRFRGAYWRWRLETAFGHGPMPSRVALFKATLDYGRWVHRMRRGI